MTSPINQFPVEHQADTGVTPWVSSWAWEGYDIIVNVNPLEEGMAYFKQLHSDSEAVAYLVTTYAERLD
ncbi:hypothetical protein [Pseudomonas sp. PDM19]|uniref:hypothetical protein n=1 Tax=Pseudomonas sp. PDM19 TaxID=2769272 RepID=UPI00177A7AAA|nr:hypothetical protein [Pseudomonas sp. PDM19]MBD9631641.1 hypothetical protein [Pseudomonas sp. PDM19]